MTTTISLDRGSFHAIVRSPKYDLDYNNTFGYLVKLNQFKGTMEEARWLAPHALTGPRRATQKIPGEATRGARPKAGRRIPEEWLS